ncbi:helix-turn-helix domain-containing protein [Nocardioides dongxiaopingii]|uniref:helix-turn-helix domain-containing protein n=1 Tax=Nocardioides sp. S-1144 TaxID=2582905 RepID=UPI0011639A77|nr:helix-turn-helix domain-containing protein [Nocardioides sp. S-1144]QCW51930.2 helix-turn-helix domain-containing protein [Nocardioides sp. S-1144]
MTATAGSWGPADLPAISPARAERYALRPGEVPQLSAYAAASSALGLRARIVLLSGRGIGPTQVARVLGVSRQTVHTWRTRYADAGLAGLHDQPPKPVRAADDRAIVAATLAPPPASVGATTWSARSLAAHLGVGHSTVARAWEAQGVRPNGADTFRVATTPELVVQLVEVVGLVLARDVRLVALLVRDATATGATRHARTRSPRTGLAPLYLYAATRAALADPAAHARRGRLDLGRWLDGLEGSGTDGARLCLVADTGDVLARPALAAWLSARPHVRTHHAGSTRRWLRLTTAFLTLAESRTTGPGCAPEMAGLLRGLTSGDLVLPAPLVWSGPGARVPVPAPPRR